MKSGKRGLDGTGAPPFPRSVREGGIASLIRTRVLPTSSMPRVRVHSLDANLGFPAAFTYRPGAGPPLARNLLNLSQLWLPHPSRFSKGGRHEPKHLLCPKSSERNTPKPVTHHSHPIVPRSIMAYASASTPLLRSRLSPVHHHHLLPASATAEQSARPRPFSACPRAGTAPLPVRPGRIRRHA